MSLTGCFGTGTVNYKLVTPSDALLMDCPMYDVDSKKVGAAVEAQLLNLDSLGKCNVDKRKLREWKIQQQEIYEKKQK